MLETYPHGSYTAQVPKLMQSESKLSGLRLTPLPRGEDTEFDIDVSCRSIYSLPKQECARWDLSGMIIRWPRVDLTASESGLLDMVT